MYSTRRENMSMAPTRVVCVEDEVEMIDLIRLILTKEGYEVIVAKGGLQALQVIEDVHPNLVLLDLMMPDLDGWEVYQRIKSNPVTKDIPVIVVTARAQSIDKVLGLHIARVDDYITKPFGPSDLLKSIETVLAKYA
jgi:two-component system, OmpR family, response regulator VicR